MYQKLGLCKLWVIIYVDMQRPGLCPLVYNMHRLASSKFGLWRMNFSAGLSASLARFMKVIPAHYWLMSNNVKPMSAERTCTGVECRKGCFRLNCRPGTHLALSLSLYQATSPPLLLQHLSLAYAAGFPPAVYGPLKNKSCLRGSGSLGQISMGNNMGFFNHHT